MKKKIEIDILLFILFEGFFLLFFFNESFLTILMGLILSILLIFVTKNIPQNKFTKFLLFIFSIPLCIITFYKVINFISENVLKNYSLIIIIIPFLFITIYLLFKEYHTFIKTIEISFYFFLLLKILSLILVIPKINLNNFNSLFSFSFNYHFIYIGFITGYLYKVILYLSNYYINKKRIIISFLNPLIIKILTILVLGNTLSSIYKYPYVNYLKSIRYFDFIERIDGILVLEYLFCFFFLFAFFLFNIKLLYKTRINK